MIKINNTLSISDKEVHYKMIKSSGPGGQNVNKNSTAVTLEIDINNSRSIPIDVKNKLLNTPHSYLTKKGIIIIKANNYKSQNRNRKDAISRLIRHFNKVLQNKKMRIGTKPTKSSIEKRLNKKKSNSLKKSLRKNPNHDKY
tara:strand:- start:14252 stop:14677 length:426 start_codon:yes stop_codon:yes gene_type:complete